MKFSVIIPAYNASRTIERTLNSVFAQTTQPLEILVMDDGSTDDTLSIIKTYEPRIRAYHQENKGVSAARNFLCREAQGDVLAFLDSDDLLHPRYLETQERALVDYPQAAASFTGHLDFNGLGEYKWDSDSSVPEISSELKGPVQFFKQYNRTPGLFMPSFCCMPKRVINDMGHEPFHPNLKITQDWHLFSMLALKGSSFVSVSNKLVAYRILDSSLSNDRLATFNEVLVAFEMVKDSYTKYASAELLNAYNNALASKMRLYAKILVAMDYKEKAKKTLIKSISVCHNPVSIFKSCFLLAASIYPEAFKRHWVTRYR